MTARKALSIATIAFLVLALFPLAAIAKPGGNGHGPAALAAGAVRHGRGPRMSAAETSGAPEVRVPPGQARKHRSADSSGSVEGTSAPKLTGIANALSRIQRNLARMQAQIDAGQRTELPAGLVSVLSKFLAWLGIPPASGAVTPIVPTSTIEPTLTIEPAPVAPPAAP